MTDNLPEGWCVAEGEDLFGFVTSGSRGWAKYYSQNGAQFLRVGNLDRDTIRLDLRHVQRVKPPRIGEGLRTGIRLGDILISITADVGMVGVAPKDLGEAYVNQHLALARPVGGFMPEYVAWYLANREGGQRQFRNLDRGAIKSGLALEDIRAVRIPLAPLAEQRRMVQKVDALVARVDVARDRIAKVPAILKRFRQTVLAAACSGKLTKEWRKRALVERLADTLRRVRVKQSRSGRAATDATIPGRCIVAVGDPGTPCPAPWRWTPLTDVARLESGHTPTRKRPEYWGGRIPWVGLQDAREHHGGRILATRQHVTDDGLANSAARLLPPGTVCLSRTASVGYVVILGRPMATSQDFVNWVCSEALEPEFLMFALLAEGESIKNFGRGTTHTTIYFPEAKALHICLPPLAEQCEIIRRIRATLAIADSIGRHVAAASARADVLTQSILATAFRGELVSTEADLARVEGRDYEPAEALLARIQAERPANSFVPKGRRHGARRPSARP